MNRRFSRIAWGLALLLLAAVLVLVNLPESAPPAGAEVGRQLPDFSVECVGGRTFRLSDQRGKTVVINLWATWCTPCVKELPHFDRLARERADVAVLALHVPPVTTDVAEYLAAFDYAIPFAVDESGEIAALLNASTVLPQTVILSPRGVVTYNRSGAMTYETLVEAVNAAK